MSEFYETEMKYFETLVHKVEKHSNIWYEKKNISTAFEFALDFKHRGTLIEGFVKLDHSNLRYPSTCWL